MPEYLQHKYALSRNGAKDMVKGFLACACSYLVLMLPVGLLYCLVADILEGPVARGRVAFYIAGIAVCLVLIFLQHLSNITPRFSPPTLKAACGA